MIETRTTDLRYMLAIIELSSSYIGLQGCLSGLLGLFGYQELKEGKDG